MAGRFPLYPNFKGTNFSTYVMRFITNAQHTVVLSQSRLAGVAVTNSDRGEVFILLDWSQFSSGTSSNTTQIANAVVPALLQTNFFPELGGHSVVEFPIHLIGHSRGGSVISEISRLLGAQGIWVDQQTTLDPHPLNNDGFAEPILSAVDASVKAYANVLYADNYYQTISSLVRGESITGAYNRKLTNLSGGYGNTGTLAPEHSNVHLWYHGTVETNTPSSDTEASITSTERNSWWTANESHGAAGGFLYSLIGGGNRLGTNEPAGSGLGQIRSGFNSALNIGSGLGARTALPSNNGFWPNALKFNLLTNAPFRPGDTVPFRFYYQCGVSSSADVRVYVDVDSNPYNINQKQIVQFQVAGTGISSISFTNISTILNGASINPGTYAVYARISDGSRTRYLYAPEPLIVLPSLQPPTLISVRGNPFQLNIVGFPGQQLIIQTSTNFADWIPLKTNTLAATNTLFIDASSPIFSRRFYRARLVP
ncbi:hypothetical protein [Pedosphaera parvula]|uniref:Alpha/beta hydrolase n=1 Tax=Pedosphaera parvula (strain Ellin514) TaxID=320771 RepID=B9XS42_PEDPL|nr:hypothetical protein [Pedosphaera parvula]EEF57338.1 hypothetical protein Cflav_PD0453 [Pedosphaera parvula Ellin514]